MRVGQDVVAKVVTSRIALLPCSGVSQLACRPRSTNARREVRAERRDSLLPSQLLPDQPSKLFESISTPTVFLQAAQFHNDLYIAGPAGLSQYNVNGSLLKHYGAGQELPSSPLVAIVPRCLPTRESRNWLSPPPRTVCCSLTDVPFRQILPQDADARTITSVLPWPLATF